MNLICIAITIFFQAGVSLQRKFINQRNNVFKALIHKVKVNCWLWYLSILIVKLIPFSLSQLQLSLFFCVFDFRDGYILYDYPRPMDLIIFFCFYFIASAFFIDFFNRFIHLSLRTILIGNIFWIFQRFISYSTISANTLFIILQICTFYVVEIKVIFTKILVWAL